MKELSFHENLLSYLEVWSWEVLQSVVGPIGVERVIYAR